MLNRTQANISRIKEIAWGLVSTAAVVSVVRLGVAEHLEAGPQSAADLANKAGADPDSMRQLLDALVARGVLQKDRDERYSHTELSLLLRKDDPNSVCYQVQWIGHPVFWRLFPHLEDAVRQGKPQSVDVLGKEFFRYVHEEEHEAVDIFSKAMTQASQHTSEHVVEALDLSDVKRVADIGGGQGHLLRTVLEHNPHLEGALQDLDGVVSNALPELQPGGELADRVTLVGGDCREAVPIDADVYLFKNILDWDDDSTVRALQCARERARPGARVVIIETFTDRTPEPEVTTSLDLLLLVNVGGRKHSSGEVSALFERAGIAFDGVRPTGTFLSLAEGTVK